MSEVKLVLRQKPNKEGKLPLALRITKDRKSSFIHLGYHLDPAEWDEAKGQVRKSHPNSARLNNFIKKKLIEAEDQSLELKTQKPHTSSRAIKQKIKPSAGGTFFAQADLYLQRLKEAGKYNQYTADKPRVKHFREFIKHDLPFPEVTVAVLERFKSYVRVKLNLSERSAVNHIVMMRSVFSHAIKEGVVDEKHYPFGKGKMKIKFPDSSKIGLNKDEVESLKTVSLEGQPHHARNLWMISYYFAGMRVSDVLRLKWSDFQNDRLHYEMGKNNKGGSLKLRTEATQILEQYKNFKRNADDLVFPELKDVNLDDKFVAQRTIAFKTSAIDKCLKTHVAPAANIDKKLTMHLARHTFAQLAGDQIPIQQLQELYRHSSILTTIGYQANFTTQDTDDALDKVLNSTSKKTRQPKLIPAKKQPD